MYPEVVFFGYSISTYFLIISLIFSFMVFGVMSRAKSLSYDLGVSLDLYLSVMVGAFLGSRLFYVFYQEPTFYFNNVKQIFYFWNGGYVFFGGLFGGALGGYLYLYKSKEPVEKWLNFVAPLLALGYAFGRLACFFAGCCYGAKTESMVSVFLHGAQRHPTQLYALFFELNLFFLLVFIEKLRLLKKVPLYSIWLIGHGFGRMFMEFFRDDPRGGFILGLSISTWISLGLMIFGGLVIIYKKRS